MSKDISKILQAWPYEPDEVGVRVIQGDDGAEKLQLRVDLGLLQMEIDGRPDGTRPGDCESWFEYYQKKQQAHEAVNPDVQFHLKEKALARLWREGVQYYHRYLGFWHLERYDLCARDTKRNLALFAFVRQHTDDERLKLQFDQWRPYVTMMYTRAVASPLVAQEQFDEAVSVIDAGIDAVRDFFDEYQQSQQAEECAELLSLEHWREEVVANQQRTASQRPKSEMEILREKLAEAIAAEEFEEAARLRDEIRVYKENNE